MFIFSVGARMQGRSGNSFFTTKTFFFLERTDKDQKAAQPPRLSWNGVKGRGFPSSLLDGRDGGVESGSRSTTPLEGFLWASSLSSLSGLVSMRGTFLRRIAKSELP